MEVNKEYESLAKFTADLSNLLQHNVVSVSGRLLEKGLVTKDVHDSMLTTEGVSGQKNAARLMSCVLDRVKCSSRCFHDFISVLREDAYFEDIVVKIVGVHALLQSSPAPPTSEDPTSSSPPSSLTVCSPPSSAVHMVGEPSNNVSVVIERLDKQYIEMEQLVFKAMKRQKVPLEDVLNWIRFPPMSLRGQFADLVQTRVKLLANVSSIDELFFILSSYWNSFHPDLLRYLINKLEDTDLNAQMDRYMADLHHFRIQITLGDFLDKWIGDIPPGYQEFVLELGEEWRKKTVEDFEQFRIRLSRLQSFGGGHMPFMKTAKSSSILVVLALPAQLFPLDMRQKNLHKLLRDANLVRVTVDGQYVFDSNKLAECEKELLKLCADKHSNITNIEHLLNQPAVDPNIFDEEGRSPLCWSCALGRADVATLLLDHGADVDLPIDNQYGESPLIIASSRGHVAVCKVLIERGATIDFQKKDTRASALIIACEMGHPEVAAVLIARGATVDYKDEEGMSPLFMASQNGHKKVAQLLLQKGAQPDIPRNDTTIPLTMASYQDHPDVCQLLIQHGSEVNYKEEDGSTALAWAALNGHKNVALVLLNAHANPDIQDQEGLTPLMLATQRGHKEIVQSLLESKANPNITDKTSGWTALHMACKEGHVEISRLLLEGGADVDVKDKNEVTPFNLAKLHGKDNICAVLNNFYNTKTEKEVTEEQREGVKKSYQRLLTILDALEEKLLPGRAEKRQRQKQSKERAANVTDSLNDTTLQV